MRIVIRIFAVIEILCGLIFAVVAVRMPFGGSQGMQSTAAFTVPGVVVGLVLAGWFLYVPFQFLRRPTGSRAVAVCYPAFLVVMAAMVSGTIFLAVGLFDETPAWTGVAVLASALGVPLSLHTFVLKPGALRAFGSDEYDEGNDNVDADAHLPVSRVDDAEHDAATGFTPSGEFMRRMRVRLIPYSLAFGTLAVAAGAWVALAGGAGWPMIGGAVVLAAGLMAVSMATAIRQQLRKYRTLRFELTPEGLVRHLAGHPRLAIRFDEVTRLVEVPERGLIVVGTGRSPQLFVSRHMMGYETLRARLAGIRVIESAAISGRSRFTGFVRLVVPAVCLLSCMVGAYLVTDPVVVTACSVAVIGGLGTCVYLIRRNPDVDRRVRRGIWAVGLVGVAMLLRIWIVWAVR